MLVTWGMCLLAVPHLVIAVQDNTAGQNTMALTAATNNNISLTDTGSLKNFAQIPAKTSKENKISVEFPDSTDEPFKIGPQDFLHLPTEGQATVTAKKHFSPVPIKTPKENEISIDFPDLAGKPVNNKTSHVETEENMKVPVDNNNTKTKELGLNKNILMTQNTVTVKKHFAPVPTKKPKENEISTDFPVSAGKPVNNKTSYVETEENVKVDNKNTKTKDLGLNENILMTQNTVNVLLSLCCIALSFTMIYFRIRTKSTKSVVHGLYLQNGIADFFVGLGVLSQSPVLYLMISKGRDISGITVPVFISFFVTAVAVKMSVFLNCVLGVVRCIQIVKPHYPINKKVLTASTLG